MLTLSDLALLAEKYRAEEKNTVTEFSVDHRPFTFNSAHYLMGVINLSPDSWYRESVVLNAEAAIRRGLALHAGGAAIVDLGAESSLAHAARIEETAQQKLLLPVVNELAQAGVLVSVETYHPAVARACLAAGAKILNLTGTMQTEEIFRAAADHEAAVVICFVQGDHVRAVADRSLPDDPIPLLTEYFARKIEEAQCCGVRRLWLDPGLGFYYRNLQDSATRIRHQMQIFLHTFRLRKLGWPVCQALPHAFECFEEEVRCAEPFFAVLALLGKTDLLRTHEVAKVRGVVRALELFGAPAKENDRHRFTKDF